MLTNFILHQKSLFGNFQNILFALFGFIFYLAVGGNLLHYNNLIDETKAFGFMCILTGIIFLIDVVVSTMKFKKG